MVPIHRILVAIVLLGNTIAFAGVDPISRAVTAGLMVALNNALQNAVGLNEEFEVKKL